MNDKNQKPAIEIKDLKKSFKNVDVLRGINFSVPKGRMLALLGPNGAGKTTTVRILSTLLRPDNGQVFIEGIDVVKDPKKARRLIGLTGQYAAVDEYLTGFENLVMIGRLYHLSRKDSEKRANELLKQFGLEEAGNRAAKTYSGGMKRRLDLALSLVATPPVIFLDEPTTGLDPRSRIAMWDVIEKLMKDGATILLTTQYLEEADKLADMIAVIDHGKVIAMGTSDELKKQVGNDFLELVISRESAVEEAKNVLGENVEIDPIERTVSVPLSHGPSDVKSILQKLEDENVVIESLSITKPSLDDVFLRLTGRNAEKDKSEK